MAAYEIPYGSHDASIQFALMPDFERGYVEAAFFTEANPDNPELADATLDDLSGEARTQITKDCAAFLASLPRDAWNRTPLDLAYDYAPQGYDAEQAGRDFWFTRNGHGVGFWDRGMGQVGDRLTRTAQRFSQVDLYRGDDGRVYLLEGRAQS